MINFVDNLNNIAYQLEKEAEAFEASSAGIMANQILSAASSVGKSWSGSMLGYHAFVYLQNFILPSASYTFDPLWGLSDGFSSTSGPWLEYTFEDVEAEILARAGNPNKDRIVAAKTTMEKFFRSKRNEFTAIISAFCSHQEDNMLSNLRDEAGKLKSILPAQNYLNQYMPKSIPTCDMLAAGQGIKTPPHLSYEAWAFEMLSCAKQTQKLADIVRRGAMYMAAKQQLVTSCSPNPHSSDLPKRVFIGHGRSRVWKDLKDFLHEKLNVEYEEFDREPVAGLSIQQRLSQILDKCSFAFLVMTAEDQQNDGSFHPRLNVVHEVGLFQGRYGFSRAIVLLEEGCKEFSNIHGLVYIKFTKDNIMAQSERIRDVLARENIL